MASFGDFHQLIKWVELRSDLFQGRADEVSFSVPASSGNPDLMWKFGTQRSQGDGI